MGKWRQLSSSPQAAVSVLTAVQCPGQESQLPPPPPLLPRPGLQMQQRLSISLCGLPDNPAEEPLDYSMKSLQSMPSPPPPSSMSASPLSNGGSSGGFGSGMYAVVDESATNHRADEVLHRLRHALLHKEQREQPSAFRPLSRLSHSETSALLFEAVRPSVFKPVPSKSAANKLRHLAPTAIVDSEAESKAVYAAECIKSRLDGCGKRVHLFLGILLHFGMPPGPDGEQMFNRVISFSDEHKNLSTEPTPYFLVLDSKLLALIWSKFKGNSSNEYSTLTRAIRSTRQKYDGIFESVRNPGKKLYKFGPVAVQQFRNLFPGSYASAV